jgi:hypothetical protein
MGKFNPAVDRYIIEAQPFARPVLEHLRALVHEACPEVEESIKWNMPCFDYHGILCSMAAFKKHASFGFWKGKLLKDPKGLLEKSHETGMGNLGKIGTIEDLPSDKILLGFLLQAKKLNEEGLSVPKEKKSKADLPIPDEFSVLLKEQGIEQQFMSMSPSHRREYLEWFAEAKTLPTRERRMLQALDMIAEKKSRNWKYEKR